MRNQGVIQGLQIALGRGVIRPDDGTADVAFARDNIAAGAFEELREGQWVTYVLASDATLSKQTAHEIEVVAE
jgi:cold shock CspA family protein